MTPERETICAISTPRGNGGIAVLRISGKEAFEICARIFTPKGPIPITQRPANSVTYGEIAENGEILDEVIVTKFNAPHSFTGEDTIEITCHGSLYIQQELLQLCIRNKCRSAQPGEFTQRAFLNGRIDLAQAEAIADLIASQSATAHRVAMNQMRGAFGKELDTLRSTLLQFVSLIELELDFSEEEVTFADRKQLYQQAANIKQKLKKLADSFSTGNAIKNGIPVAIIGKTNAGKSTLLNQLVGDERAIVSDIHGTTRDTIEETITIQGQTYRFIDTAGIRTTQDSIEQLGIERTYQKTKQADLVLWVVDTTTSNTEWEDTYEKLIPYITNKPILLLLNKSDKVQQTIKLPETLKEKDHLSISAKQNTGIEEIKTWLFKNSNTQNNDQDMVIITNSRHYECLLQAHESIERVLNGLNNNLPTDLTAIDIRQTIHHIGKITGQITTNEILGNIFKNFCIGK